MRRKRPVRMGERRENQRRSVLYPAYLLFMRRRFRCRLVEISESGICLTGAPALSLGTPVMVETLLLGRRPGVVAHRTGTKMGVALFGSPIKNSQSREHDGDES